MKELEEINVGKNTYYFAYNKNQSRRYYTQKIVYDIATYNNNLEETKRDILKIMIDKYGIMLSRKDYIELNTIAPSIANSLLHYYELIYNVEDDTFKFILTIPYDD